LAKSLECLLGKFGCAAIVTASIINKFQLAVDDLEFAGRGNVTSRHEA
jgi:hypothetical protein